MSSNHEASEAEAGILACILQEPKCLPVAASVLRKRGEEFYDLRHKTVFEAMLEMSESGEAVDVVSLAERLKDRGLLEQVGGLSAVSRMADAAPSPANLSFYLSIVSDKAALREASRVCYKWFNELKSWAGDPKPILDKIERDILSVRIDLEARSDAEKTAKELTVESLDEAEKFHAANGQPTGLQTGLVDLDRLVLGLHPGEMTVVAAFPSVGKSALAGNVAENLAVNFGVPVGIFTLEMTARSLISRMIGSLARVNMRSLRDGDFKKVTVAAGKIAKAPIHIDDGVGVTVWDIRARARRMWQQHRVGLLVIDYIQLVQGVDRRDANRQQEVAEISSGIKALARELGVPILALSQLNDDGKFRESRAIGQDADNVWILSARKKKDKDDEDKLDADACQVDLVVSKQRNGPRGIVRLVFVRPFVRFESASRVSDE